MTSGSGKRKRNTHLTIRLTAEERAVIENAAAASNLTPGSYARNILLGAQAPRQVRRPPIERRELSRLLGELGKIGSNLNQLAKESNQGEPPYKREIMAVLSLLVRVCDAILFALGRAP